MKRYAASPENTIINVIAVDSDQDGKVSFAEDIVVMRKVLLGVETYENYIYNNGFIEQSW